ncbi:MAG: T9SS type A sorting domain-containing protein [Saprospiraceae bacterium]
MKRLFFLSMLFLQMSLLNAQSIECYDNPDFRNGSFEEINNCGFNQGVIVNAFALGCVPSWYAATGSPDVANATSGITAQDGANYMRMGAANNGQCRTEAAFIEVDMVPGKIYELSFYHRTTEFTLNDLSDLPLNLNIFATSGLINNNNGPILDDCLDLSSESQELYTATSFFSEDWVKVTISNITVDAPQTQLLFFPGSNNNVASFWLLDNVKLVECACFDDCLPPTGLNCRLNQGSNNSLSWNPVSGAVGYIIKIVKKKLICGCTNNANSTRFFYRTSPILVLPNNLTNGCFSWSVQTDCGEGVTSQYSESSCFGPEGECSSIGPTFGFKATKPSDSATPNVYPNPTSKELNFSYQSEADLSVNISIYALDGKLVKRFPEEKYPDGNLNKSWTITQDIPSGVYIVHFNTNNGNFQKKVLINKDSK